MVHMKKEKKIAAIAGGQKPPSLEVCKWYLLTYKRAVLCGILRTTGP